MIWDILLGLDTGFAVIGLGTMTVLIRKAIAVRKTLGQTRNGYVPKHSDFSQFKAPTEDELK